MSVRNTTSALVSSGVSPALYKVTISFSRQMRWKHYLLYSIRLVEIISLVLAPLLLLQSYQPYNAIISRYSWGGGGGYQFIGFEFASLTIGSNTEYYGIGLTYNGTNATLWLELYNSTEYSNVKNWTAVYELGFSGNQAYNYTALCQAVDSIINTCDNILYMYGYWDLGFPLVFYVNQTTDQLLMWVPVNATDPGVIAAYVYPGAGSTVYVYGWTYVYVTEGGDTYVYFPLTRIFVYEVQFNNQANAIRFMNDFPNFLQEWQKYINNNEFDFLDVYNFFNPDNNDFVSLRAMIQEDYGGTILRTAFPQVIGGSGYSEFRLSTLASAIENDFENYINPELGVELPDDIFYFEGIIKIPSGAAPVVGGIIEDEDYQY